LLLRQPLLRQSFTHAIQYDNILQQKVVYEDTCVSQCV